MLRVLSCFDVKTRRQLDLTRIVVNVRMVGYLMEVETTARFENRSNVDVEGEVVFPLDDESTICGYACDVKGT